MQDAALRLASLGYKVFPCAPGAKTPLTAHGFLEATCDEDQISKWWTANPLANVGLATAGLLVLDVDGPANQFLDDPERCLALASGVLSLTPRGGRHYFYKQPTGRKLRNTASKIAPMVDTRGDGGYVLVNPSIVGGKSYGWPNGELDVTPGRLAEPPAFLLALLDAESPVGNLESVRLAESQPGNAIPSGQRNQTLTSLAGTMRRAGMSQGEILAALKVANAERCKPSMNESEVETIAASVAHYEPDQIAVAVAEGHWEQMGADAEPVADGVEAPAAIPPGLLRVPGFVDDLADYIMATAPYPERTLAFGSAFAAQAFLASRKVRDESGNRTSLYLVALAESGAGKDWGRKVVKSLFLDAGLIDCIGDKIASAEGLEDLLYAKPAFLLLRDEFHALLAAIKSGRDPRSEGVAEVLLTIFGNADSQYALRAKAGKPTMFIDQPALSILGSSIPSEFYDSLSPRMLVNGLFARLLILEAGKRGLGQEPVAIAIPDSLKQTAKWWANFSPAERRQNLESLHPTPRLVPASAAAKGILADLRADCDRRRDAAIEKSDRAGIAVWSRCNEKARRLSLNHACSADHLNPEITEAAATWAADFSKFQAERMVWMARNFVAESPFEGQCQRAVDALRRLRDRKGDEWMPGWKFNRCLKHLTPREQQAVKESLLGQGKIERRATDPLAAHRPGEAYRLR